MKPGIGPRIEGRRILVTGGGTGIGAATARACAEAGMKVLVSGRRSEPLQRVVDEIVGRGGVHGVGVEQESVLACWGGGMHRAVH